MMDSYERNKNMPKAGFTAGPCLLKDTMQLSSYYKHQFPLFLSAKSINENGSLNVMLDDGSVFVASAGEVTLQTIIAT